MRTKKILPITEARKNIFALAEDVQKNVECYTLTERGQSKAVVISAEKYEKLVTSTSLT